MDILGRLCRCLPNARTAWCLLAARSRIRWLLGAPQRGELMVSGDRSDIGAGYSMLLVWRWLAEVGRYSLRCLVIRANQHVCNGPLRADALRQRPLVRPRTCPQTTCEVSPSVGCRTGGPRSWASYREHRFSDI